MKVGILGSGEAGQALGRGFAGRGHDVKIGPRNPKSEALLKWQTQTKGKTSTGTFEETAKYGDILVLAALGERVQRRVPDAKVVKCFNTVPNTQMVDPKFAGGNPEMLICGDDAAAKQKVVSILKEFGWPGAIDVGGIEGARWLEATVPLWVLVGQQLGRWDHAFRIVHG